MSSAGASSGPRRIFRVGPIELDETRQELSIGGQRRPVEAKPLAVLQALLVRAGTRVGKRELIETVWGNADHISEASLTTAVSKLRAALGEAGRDLIDVVPGSGYRIAAVVEVSTARGTELALALRPQDTVPGRPQWLLRALLGHPTLNDVWMAAHEKTGELRVFKFADSTKRLATLRREAALSRVLHTALGPRDDLIRVLEWNFEERPYFMESPYGGPNLPDWAAAQGGLASVSLADRLAMVARIARTLGAAHAAGVLHGDIKPANILVEPVPDAPPRLRLVDFGAGGLNDLSRLGYVAISLDGLDDGSTGRTSGTLRYMAPEVLAGGTPTTVADMYALGVLLFQMAVADLDRPLTLGWDADIDDSLLREDIALTAAGDPARRLPSAVTLAERLETLPARREALRRAADAAARAEALAQEVERARLRRPWMLLAAGSLLLGLVLSTVFGLNAMRDRNKAERSETVAKSVNAFLTEDLLGRGNPANSGTADETLMGAAEAAEAGIDRRLANDPMIAGSIYLALARAFDSRSTYGPARTAYRHAVAAFTAAGREGAADAVIARLHEASMEVASGSPGSLAVARRMLTQTEPQIAKLGNRRREAEVWLYEAMAIQQMLGGDVRSAQTEYARAADLAQSMPDVFDPSTQLALRQREAFTNMRLGDFHAAEGLFKQLLRQRLALNGPRHPDTLETELNLAQIQIAQGRAAAALPVLDRIAPDFVAVFGAKHLRTLLLLATRGQALQQLEHYDAALQYQMTVYQIATATLGKSSYVAVGGLADAAVTRCRAGQAAPGTAMARTAQALSVSAFGARAVLTQLIEADLAFCLVQQGDNANALPLLDGIDTKSLADLTMDPHYGAETKLLRAAALVGLGRGQAAAALLAQVGPVFDQPDADPFLRRWASKLRVTASQH